MAILLTFDTLRKIEVVTHITQNEISSTCSIWKNEKW